MSVCKDFLTHLITSGTHTHAQSSIIDASHGAAEVHRNKDVSIRELR